MSTLLLAATRLERVLLAENAALASLNVLALPALLAEKLAASQDLAAASHQPSPRTPEFTALALRLRDLARENRQLLERAIEVQGRVMRLVAVAARQASLRGAPSYGAAGQARPERGAVALHTRA